MKYEEGGYDQTPYERILGGIHTPARAADEDTEKEYVSAMEEVPALETEKAEEKWREDLARVAEIEEVIEEAYEVEKESFSEYERITPIDDGAVFARAATPVRDIVFTTVEYTDTYDENPVRVIVEEDILVPDIKPDMASILSMDGIVRCQEREFRTGVQAQETVNVTGDIMLKTLYLPDRNDCDSVITIQSRVPFKTEWRVEVPRLSTVSVVPLIENVEYSVINERKFRAKVTVLLTMREFIKKSMNFFEGIEGDEVQLFKEKISFTDASARKTDSIEINEEIYLKEGMPEPEQILRYDLRTVENNRQITGEKAVINGTVYCNILYLAKDDTDDNVPFLHQGKTEFTQFIALSADGSQAGSRVRFDDSGLGIKIKVAGNVSDYDDFDEDDDKIQNSGTAAFVFDGNVHTTVELYRNIESEVATDVYHNEKELIFESEEFVCGALEGSGVCEVSVREIVNIPAEDGDIDRVIYVSGKAKDLWCETEYAKEAVGGNFEVEILAMPADEAGKPFRIVKSIPFRGNMDIAAARSGMTAECDIFVKELRCDKINNKQIEINAGVLACGMVYSKAAQRLIKNPAFLEADIKEMKKPGMILYVTKAGDNLWSIAKRFRTTMDKISRVNGIEDGDVIAEGKKLLIVK